MTSSSPNADRRAALRLPLQLAVLTQSNGHPIHGVSRDISAAGVFFSAHTVITRQSRVSLMVVLPADGGGDKGLVWHAGNIVVWCTGTVIRVEELSTKCYGIAIAFEQRPIGTIL